MPRKQNLPHSRPSKIKPEEVLEEVARLDMMGYSLFAIARKMKASYNDAKTWVLKIKKRYEASIIDSREFLVREKLEQYAYIRREAIEAWLRSMKPFERRVVENSLNDSGDFSREITTTESAYGDSAFLKIINDTLAAERDLLGLDAPKKIDMTVEAWDAFSETKIPMPVQDAIEAEILAIEHKPGTNGQALHGSNGVAK